MIILNKFKIGDTISFELHVTSILAQNYDNVKVRGLIPAKLCDIAGLDAYAIHAQVFPLLPKGSVENNADSYQYLLVEDERGNHRAVGLPWINLATVKVHNQETVSFTVPNIAAEDIPRIRDVIARYGYTCELKVK